MGNNSKKNFLKIGITLLVIFLIFFLIGTEKDAITFELKKANIPVSMIRSNADTIAKDSIITTDTVKKADKPEDKKLIPADTSGGKRILLIGDSELEGLRGPVYSYCVGSGYNLVGSVLWYSSTTRDWAKTDTLEYFLKKFAPSKVIIALGLNEIFTRDLQARKNYISLILDKLKKRKIQYYWIGPAAWAPDLGLTKAMGEAVGTNFYPSAHLKMDRAIDRRHPTLNAAKVWFDSVAVSIKKVGFADFAVKKEEKPKRTSPLVILKPRR